MILLGKGILGLASAEYFSRPEVKKRLSVQNMTVVFSAQNSWDGSQAAAANLATKGQLFARDPHFAFKLEGKKRYAPWLNSLLRELNDSCHGSLDSGPLFFEFAGRKFCIDDLYRSGTGLDFFQNEADAKRQFVRVRQNENELHKRNLPNHSLGHQDEKTLYYRDEGWVHARALLALLEQVCSKRGVEFLEHTITSKLDFEAILNSRCTDRYFILCPGAGVLPLLETLEIEIPPQLQRPMRLSAGSTLFLEGMPFRSISNAVLLEQVDLQNHLKITLSGSSAATFASSTTVKLDSETSYSERFFCGGTNVQLSENEKEKWHFANAKFTSCALEFANKVLAEPFESSANQHVASGFRIGFGHQEIVFSTLRPLRTDLVACLAVGAHKSGFLLAPVVGEQLENLLLRP